MKTLWTVTFWALAALVIGAGLGIPTYSVLTSKPYQPPDRSEPPTAIHEVEGQKLYRLRDPAGQYHYFFKGGPVTDPGARRSGK